MQPIMLGRFLIIISVLSLAILLILVIARTVLFIRVLKSCRDFSKQSANAELLMTKEAALTIEGQLNRFNVFLPLGAYLNAFFILYSILILFSNSIRGFQLSGSYYGSILEWNWPEIFLLTYEIVCSVIVILLFVIAWTVFNHWRANIIRKFELYRFKKELDVKI